MKYTLLFFSFLLCLCSQSIYAQVNGGISLAHPKYLKGNTYAVIVGISDYVDDALDLSVADKDGLAFNKYLRTHGFPALRADQVQLLLNHDATLGGIIKALQWLTTVATAQDRVIFFFSGHGAPNGVAPADYRRTDGGNLLTHYVIKSHLKQCLSTQVLMVVDACHAGGTESASYLGAVGDLLNGYKNSGIAMILSSNIQQSSREYPSEGLSYFTHYLLEGIVGGYANRNKDNLITLGEAFEYVKLNVHVMTNETQTPQTGGDFDPNIVMRLK